MRIAALYNSSNIIRHGKYYETSDSHHPHLSDSVLLYLLATCPHCLSFSILKCVSCRVCLWMYKSKRRGRRLYVYRNVRAIVLART